MRFTVETHFRDGRVACKDFYSPDELSAIRAVMTAMWPRADVRSIQLVASDSERLVGGAFDTLPEKGDGDHARGEESPLKSIA